jgi:preprotein translocase subunit YajC
MLIGKKVRVIKVVIFESGRKIKIEYIGELTKVSEETIVVKELDNTKVLIQKKFIKRIEEFNQKESVML